MPFSKMSVADAMSKRGSVDPMYSDVSVVEYPHIYVERTLAIIKPDAIEKAKEIEDIILNSGFQIAQRRKVHFTPEQTSDFYSSHYGKMFFPGLVAYMSSAPIVALVLLKNDAIAAWQNLIGPTNPLKGKETHPGCLRATYGTDETRNALHGSQNRESAEKEIRFLFRDNILEPLTKGEAAQDYLSKKVNPTLFKALAAISKSKPADPIIWLADWLLENNPYQPRVHGNEVVEEVE